MEAGRKSESVEDIVTDSFEEGGGGRGDELLWQRTVEELMRMKGKLLWQRTFEKLMRMDDVDMDR